MNKRFIYFLAILLLPFLSLSQLKSTDCNSIKNGNFYFYPPNSQNEFLIVRDKSIQKEINIKTGNTSLWKVKWQSPCIFTLNFLQKSQPISKEELIYFKAHQTVVEVINVTKEYYVFKGGLDTITNVSFFMDTLWLKRKQFSNRN